mgnify:CR=1 FL=1
MTGQISKDSLPRAGVWRLTVEAADQGERLDRFLPQALPQLSRGQWRKVIDLGGIHYNGRRTRRCSIHLQVGDRVEAYVDGRSLDPYRLDEHSLVFRDRYLVALNKPYGIETQPTHARFVGTLYEAMLVWLREQARNPRSEPNLGMIQRLDRDTSGLILFSIHPHAHAGLTKAFTARQARKVYLALVAGTMEGEGEFCSMLARSRKGNLVKSVPAGGKEAITRYRVLESNQDCSLVLVEPKTGRSHQIRAHFSEAGHPLLGDSRYGGPMKLASQHIGRQQLHAWRLEVLHPVTKEALKLQAPIHEDTQALLIHLGWSLDVSGEIA